MHETRRGRALDEEELDGSSPGLLWVSRGRRLGLAVVGGSSVRRRPVVVLPDGSPAKARGKTMSWRSGDAPHPNGRVWEGANR
jgi:hypothetical protein